MNFLLGVGAQRCGTTWLHGYLARHPAVFMSPFKELHVFDAIYAPETSGYTREKRFDELRGFLARIVRGEPVNRNDLLIAIERYDLALGENTYLGHFRRYVRPEQRVMGEITPSYSLIPAAGFASIRDLLVKAALKPKVVFIMRDPVERMYSQLRFNERRGVARVQDAYATALTTPGITQRTRYDLTLANLEAAFEADELLFLLYEEMFRPATVEAICRFLGIETRPADFADRVNAAPEVGDIDPAFSRAAREHLDIVYEACAERFGRERIRALWKYY